MEGLTFALVLVLNMGYFQINLDTDAQNLYTISFLWLMGNKYKLLLMDIKIACFLVNLKMLCLSLSKIWNMWTEPYYLDALLLVTNSRFKDHLLKLYPHGEIQIQTLTYGNQDFLVPDVFQNFMSNIFQDMEYVLKAIPSWWVVNTNK
jgi:hypothetical protein